MKVLFRLFRYFCLFRILSFLTPFCNALFENNGLEFLL